MSSFMFNGAADTATYNLLAPAGHPLLTQSAFSYSYAGATPTQTVYVFGNGFLYSGNSVVSGTPYLVLDTDNGLPVAEARFFGGSATTIQQLSQLSAADQITSLSSGDDYFSASRTTAHTNTFNGSTGNDTFADGLGTTIINGGAGTDTANLNFKFTDASFGFANNTVTITAPGYNDQITNVENFQFTDRIFTSLSDLGRAAGFNVGTSNVYRFYDTVTNDHFYTTDPSEKAAIQANLKTLTYEGTPWTTPDKGSNTTDVYRFYDPATKTHFLTDNAVERDSLIKNAPAFKYEGVSFQAFTNADDAGAVVLERFYNTNTKVHTYALADEANQIRAGGSGQGWVDEGQGFIVHV